jgi:hypothetical protein
MSKSTRKAAQQWKTDPKLIKARHEESASYTEFQVFTVGADGKEAEIIGDGSFEGVNLENTTAMLTQLARSLGCELEWESFANVSPEEFSKRQHMLEEYRTEKMEHRNE